MNPFKTEYLTLFIFSHRFRRGQNQGERRLKGGAGMLLLISAPCDITKG